MHLQPENITSSLAYDERTGGYDQSKPQWYRECHCLTMIYDAYSENDVSTTIYGYKGILKGKVGLTQRMGGKLSEDLVNCMPSPHKVCRI